MKPLFALMTAMLFASTIAMPAAAQWKWRDASGRVQYSDRPPPAGIADKDVLQRPPAGPAASVKAPAAATAASAVVAAAAAPASAASGAAASASAPSRVDPVLEAKRRDAERAEAARQKHESEKLAATRADNCQRAKAQLRTLDDGMRIARVNPNGEREFLDDNARAAEAARARSIIATDCR